MRVVELARITQELGDRGQFFETMLSGIPNFQHSIIPTVMES